MMQLPVALAKGGKATGYVAALALLAGLDLTVLGDLLALGLVFGQ